MKTFAEKSSHHQTSSQARARKDTAGLPDRRDVSISQSTVDNSSVVAAQRTQIESAFGEAVQRQPLEEEEEEPLQGKFTTLQRQSISEEEPLQGKFSTVTNPVLQKKDEPPPNRTGLPDGLKAGVESLSGLSLDDVRVHYDSARPAELQALAYTQGTDIHVAPRQERHLPHEAWHVVQQMQGRVKPTMQMKEDLPINDDEMLEQEADVMGAKASVSPVQRRELPMSSVGVIQMERYVNNVNSRIHLHLDIGNGDHLQIFGQRYNLKNQAGYDAGRITIAKRALRRAPYVPDKVACWQELQRL